MADGGRPATAAEREASQPRRRPAVLDLARSSSYLLQSYSSLPTVTYRSRAPVRAIVLGCCPHHAWRAEKKSEHPYPSLSR
jgi:hypothetical protein